MGTFAVIAEHPPQLCPTSNSRTRQMMNEGAPRIPQLAERLGVEIVTLRVFGPDHILLAVVDANDIEAVRDFIFQTGLIQWNTTNIHPTYSMEEALARVNEMETIF
jgi:predicted RecB family endonuclease